MNGRVYDPVIARFLSPDPYVQAPESSQNFNRYSYALNNPLKYTDPSGNLFYIIPSVSGSGSGISMSLTVGVGFGPALGVDITVGYDNYSSGFSVSIGAHAGGVAHVYGGWGNKTGWFAGAGIGFSIGANMGTNMTSVGFYYSEKGGLSVNAFGFTYADNHWRFNPVVSFSVKFDITKAKQAGADASQAAPEADSDVSLKVKEKTPTQMLGRGPSDGYPGGGMSYEPFSDDPPELQSENGEQVEENAVGDINDLSIALAETINAYSQIPIMLGPFPVPNPLLGAGALSIDGGANLVGSEADAGIILVLQGEDKGRFTTYTELAGGYGTGGSIGGEIARFDYSKGNKNIILSMLEGTRNKIYAGGSFGGLFGIGGAVTWAKPEEGGIIYGTTVSFGWGGSPLGIDIGKNKGEVKF
jgi:hypothetical protein